MKNVTPEMRSRWSQRIKTLVAAQKLGYVFTDWETNFIVHLAEKLNDKKDLTFNESSCLSRIYSKVS